MASDSSEEPQPGPSRRMDEEFERETAGGTRHENPWPYLQDFFTFLPERTQSSQGKVTLHFRCNKCPPGQQVYRQQMGTLYNLRSHVTRKHSTLLNHFNLLVKTNATPGKKRTASTSSVSSTVSSQISEPPSKKTRQLSLAQAFAQSSSGSSVRQADVDESIMRMFVDNMIPLHVVESSSFHHLVHTLNPTKASMSRRTLGRRIEESHRKLEAHLITIYF